jgi:hypothetical protein
MKGMTVTVHRSMPTVGLALLIVGFLTACSAPGNSPSPPTTEASPASSVAPTTTVIPSTIASEEPPAPEPTPEPQIPEPPAASIAVDGGDPVVGELGSFGWKNAGSDSPWLDGSPIHVGAGELLVFTLAEPVAIESWQASRVIPGDRDETGAVGIGEGSGEPITFDAPPSGSWSVGVSVLFVDNLGSAAYYWLIEVD